MLEFWHLVEGSVVSLSEFTTQNLVMLTRPVSIGIKEYLGLLAELGCIRNVLAAGDEEDEDKKDEGIEESTG